MAQLAAQQKSDSATQVNFIYKVKPLVEAEGSEEDTSKTEEPGQTQLVSIRVRQRTYNG